MVIKLLKEPSDNFNSVIKDMKTIKTNQSEMKDTMTEMKNNLQGINSGVDDTKNQTSKISNFKYKKVKNTQSEQQVEKESKIIKIVFWDNFRHTNLHIMGVPEGEKKQ